MKTDLKRLGRAGIGFAVVAALGWFAACSDNPFVVDPCPPCQLQGVMVSNPVPVSAPGAGTRAAIGVAPGAASDEVYVSLAPGTAPTGTRATVRRVGDATVVVPAVTGGGFDPVPVTAQVGDSIDVAVTGAGGDTVYHVRVAVLAARPPVIVRTEPPPRKRDVPLNASMVIVFSEPVDSATLTPASVRLLRGGIEVAGSIHVLDAAQLRVAFVPDAQLAARTDYQLVVSQTVRDRDGQPLAAAETVPFTTGTSLVGTPASITFSVDTGTVLVAGATLQLTATVRDAAGTELTGQPVTWFIAFTTDPNVVTVSATGLVTAVGDGTALIGASAGAASNQTSFHVAALPAASVTIAPATTTVGAGDTVIVTATVRDATGRIINHPSVTWASSAPAVATVATVGSDQRIATVAAVSPGSVTITASSGTGSGTAEITIGPQVPVASVTVTPPVASVVVQGTVQLAAILRDANGKVLFPRPTAWTSDNAAVATVDAAGLVTAAGVGSASVTATTEGVSGTSTITVTSVVFVSLFAGGGNTCGLAASGAAYCWGFNQSGQVGDGSTMNRLVPVAVVGGLSFTALGLGYYHACGIANGGAMYCWGSNGGQLGDGTTIDRWAPVPVSGGLTFTAVTANNVWTCGLTTGGAAYCWGVGSSSVPVLVAGGHTFTEVSAGNSHACGLTNGAAYCWGNGTSGELGNGSFVGSSDPVRVAGGLSFTALTANGAHTCGLTASGAAYCWGESADSNGGNSAVPVRVSGGQTFSELSAGTRHICALTALGEAYCWGRNDEGELGDGTFVSSAAPVRVSGSIRFGALTASQHTCGMTVTGIAFCWGDNTFGQLGDGSTTNRGAPVKVVGQP